MKKIIFSDIDRTLAIEGNVSIENKESIKKYTELGNIFVLASGRTISYTVSLSKKINASNYVICSNGGVVYDYLNDYIIYKKTIPYKIVKKLFEIANFYNARLIIGSVKQVYTNKIKYEDKEVLISDVTKELYDSNPITQITISDKDINIISEIIDEVDKLKEIKILNRHRSLYDSTFKGNDNIWIDIASASVNKGKAVKKLLEYLNINIEDSVRIGDDLNDLSMFFDKGLNVAVQNAIPLLKQKANYITRPCLEGGISNVIMKLINDEL